MANQFLGLFRPAPLSESIKLYLSANALLRAAGIGRGILLTWLMISPAEFGVYQIGLLLVNILLPVLSIGSYEGIARYVPEYETKRQLWRYLRSVFPFCLAVGICTCGLLFVLAGPICTVLFGTNLTGGNDEATQLVTAMDRTRLTRLVASCVAVLVLYHLVLAILRGRRMFRGVSMMELTAGILFTVFAVLAALIGRGSGVVILAIYTTSNLLTAVVFGIPALWFVRRDSSDQGPAISSDSLRHLAKYGFWAGWAAFFWQLLFLFPALYLNRVCGEEVLATYRAMTILTQIGYVAPAAISVAVASAVIVSWESSGRDKALAQLNLSSKAVLAVVLIFCLIFASLKSVIILAFRAEYRGGADVVPLLLLFYLTAGALSLVTIRFTLIKKTALTFLCWVVGCAVAVMFSTLGVVSDDPVRALLTTAWANVTGVMIALVVAMVLLYGRRLLPDRGTLILLAGMFLLLAQTPYIVAGMLAIVVLSSSTSLIFDERERQVLLKRAFQLLNFKSAFPDRARSDNDVVP